MSSAALVFMDIVGYSKESTDSQFEAIMYLNREVYYVLYRDFDPARPKVIALPTGDGMVLALLDEEEPRPDLVDKCFELLISLYRWSNDYGIATLRYGLHYGPISYVRDINGKRNICGDAVNIAARFMSLGEKNHIIASSDFITRFVPECTQEVGQWCSKGDYSYKVIEEIDIRVKHNRRILGYNINLKHGETTAGNSDSIDAIKHYTEVQFPSTSKEESRKSTLPKLFSNAKGITLIGPYASST